MSSFLFILLVPVENELLHSICVWWQEDIALRELVGKLGTKWAAISREMARHGAGRVGKQCRERWNHQLNPGLVKGKWTSEEVRYVYVLHAPSLKRTPFIPMDYHKNYRP
jgi:hypothetical protein